MKAGQGISPTPPKIGGQLHQPSTSAHSLAILKLQNRELLTRPKPSSRSAGRVLQAGGRRGWTVATPLQTRYQQPHRSPTRSTDPLSKQLRSVRILPPFQALCLQYFIIFHCLCAFIQPTLSAHFLCLK